MSIYSPTMKREEDKVYVSEHSGSYAVTIGREEKARIVFETQCVNTMHPDFPKDESKASALWIILKHESFEKNSNEVVTLVETDYSSWKMMDAYQKAHDLALDYAEGQLGLSQCIAAWPVTTPDAKGPTRNPNHVTLTKIIDNSRCIHGNDSKLVEYLKEPVSFVL